MVQIIETEKQHLIPVTDVTGIREGWEQICEIPVIQTEEVVSQLTFFKLRFLLGPDKPSGLDILAGGTNMEAAERSMRGQLIRQLENAKKEPKNDYPLERLILNAQQISKYFRRTVNDSSVQRVL